MHLLAKNYLLTTIYLYIGGMMVQRPYMKKHNETKEHNDSMIEKLLNSLQNNVIC